MRSRDLAGIFIFLLLVPLMAAGQKSFTEIGDPSLFIRKFNDAAAKVSTIESSFTQEKNLSMLSEKVITKGKFYFKKENRLRWEYTEPFTYLIIFRDGRIFIRDEAKETRFDTRESRMFSEINTIILGSVSGTLFTDKKRFSSTFSENQVQYLVRLKPLSPQLKEYLSEIRIFFDKNDMTVTAVEMEENSGDDTMILFTSKKLNTNIPDEKFAF